MEASKVVKSFFVRNGKDDEFKRLDDVMSLVGDGDEIVLAPHTHYGSRFDFEGKKVLVRGTEPTNFEVVRRTEVRAAGLSGPIFRLRAGEELKGFTITNAFGTEGYGLWCAPDSRPIIRNCVIVGNRCLPPSGSSWKRGDAAVLCGDRSQVLFEECEFGRNSGDLFCVGEDAVVDIQGGRITDFTSRVRVDIRSIVTFDGIGCWILNKPKKAFGAGEVRVLNEVIEEPPERECGPKVPTEELRVRFAKWQERGGGPPIE